MPNVVVPHLVRRLRDARLVVRGALEALDVADADVAVPGRPRLRALLVKLAAELGARRARGAACAHEQYRGEDGDDPSRDGSRAITLEIRNPPNYHPDLAELPFF